MRSMLMSRVTSGGFVTSRRLSKFSTVSFDGKTDAEIRFTILEAALGNVPLLGWTDDAIAKSMRDIGYDSLSHTMINSGPVDLVTHFMNAKKDHVSEQLAKKYFAVGLDDNGAQTNSDEVVCDAIEMHLDYIAPYLSSWPKALALLAEPSQIPNTINLMTETADDICHYAGMKSSRMDWYSDRGLVLVVFCSTELYMLTDYSEKMQDTRDFLRRNIVYYQKIKSNPSLAFLLQSALTNIFSEFSNFASDNSCVKPNNNNNNSSNNTSSNNYRNFNPDMDDHSSPNSKDFPGESHEDERNVKNPA